MSGYGKKLDSTFKKKKLKIGDGIKVTKAKNSYEGVLMPKAAGDSDIVVVKLKNGYNIGIRFGKGVKIEKIKLPKVEREDREEKPCFDTTRPKASIIVTGGTISSKIDYKTGGVTALTEPDELLGAIPELGKIICLRHVSSPFTKMSESIGYQDWQILAKEIEKHLKDGDEGVIVTHGTDTLHYTAAALSFMLETSKPVVLVGSQRSTDRGSSDSAMNLICASHLIANAKELGIGGVGICMHASIEDDFCYFIRGTKVRKMHTSRRDAFRPINAKPIAKIWKDGKIEVIDPLKVDTKIIRADTKFEPKVALIKATPGSSPEIINFYVKKKYKGLVIEAFGLGQISSERWSKKNAWLPAIQNAIKKGVTVCFAAQTIYGRLSPKVYSEAREAEEVGVIYLEDMLSETAWIKLGWVLAHEKKKIRELMLTNLRGEITERTEIDTFLV